MAPRGVFSEFLLCRGGMNMVKMCKNGTIREKDNSSQLADFFEI